MMRFSTQAAVVVGLLCLAYPCFAENSAQDKGKGKSCSILLDSGLPIQQSFILQVSSKLFTAGTLPKSSLATYRLLEIGGASEVGAADKDQLLKVFQETLAEIGLTLEDWKSLEGIEFKEKEFLVTTAFTQLIDRMDLTSEQKTALKKLDEAAEVARGQLRAALSQAEAESLNRNARFLPESELDLIIQRLVRDPKSGLKKLGLGALSEWRYRVLVGRDPKSRKQLEKKILDAFKDYASGTGSIPESDDILYTEMSEIIGNTTDDIKYFFGEKGLFKTTSEFIERAKTESPGVFTKVLDKRIFTEARKQRMREAIRNASDLVVFKLGENQDLINFEEVERIANELNAPIIVSPAFSEIGLIPNKLKWLFDHPNVHIFAGEMIQISKDMYLINNGAADKDENPFVGLPRYFQPTDRAIFFHSKVRTLTRPSGNYDTQTSYFTTTGTMSNPVFNSQFTQGMKMDFRAKREGKVNRSVMVLSRRYKHSIFGDQIGSSHGIAPRRVSFTPGYFGNREGLFDLGKLYTKDSVEKLKWLPGIVLADLHAPNTDPKYLKAALKLLIDLEVLVKNPHFGAPGEYELTQGPVELGFITIHDLADSLSLNEHIRDALLTRSKLDFDAALSIESSFKRVAAVANQLMKLLPNTRFVVPVDNHGYDWLMKRLQNGDLTRGMMPKDAPMVLRLMVEAIENRINPYERVFQNYGVDTSQFIFLTPDDTYRVGIDLKSPNKYGILQGNEIGQHSQMGINGAKSISLIRLLEAYGANVTGHTHSTAEHGQSKKVGTATNIRQDYHRGPSGSDQSIAIVYSPEAVQILRLEKGTFIPNAPGRPAEEFFPSDEFPVVTEREKLPEGLTTSEQLRSNPPVDSYRRSR